MCCCCVSSRYLRLVALSVTYAYRYCFFHGTKPIYICSRGCITTTDFCLIAFSVTYANRCLVLQCPICIIMRNSRISTCDYLSARVIQTNAFAIGRSFKNGSITIYVRCIRSIRTYRVKCICGTIPDLVVAFTYCLLLLKCAKIVIVCNSCIGSCLYPGCAI